MIDGKAQEVFQNGGLTKKGFLDFYGTVQAAEDRQPVPALCTESGRIWQIQDLEKWKEEGKVVQDRKQKRIQLVSGQEYGFVSSSRGTPSRKAYDISQIRTKQPEEGQSQKPIDRDGSTAD